MLKMHRFGFGLFSAGFSNLLEWRRLVAVIGGRALCFCCMWNDRGEPVGVDLLQDRSWNYEDDIMADDFSTHSEAASLGLYSSPDATEWSRNLLLLECTYMLYAAAAVGYILKQRGLWKLLLGAAVLWNSKTVDAARCHLVG
ncbi:hypothetical protein Nepgr_015884 [Nepenthes gracilis]|uniref:Uncharacterized protein n=1 Tax=Nepenthes gracilis TaxID=150966 RepID=A0AAD3SLS6_NEPGR|nr:hypothetical protein Nepgr_015884 [Nepenthes gracilis]